MLLLSEENKINVISKLLDLVAQYRKVSKIQIKATSNMVVHDNQKITRKALRVDDKAKESLLKEQEIKQTLHLKEIELRTYQDARVHRGPHVTDGTVQTLTSENALRKRQIRDLGVFIIISRITFVGHSIVKF